VSTLPDFNQAVLARAIESLTSDELDLLPFGVIGLDPAGVVRVYNKTEARLSGRKARPTQGLSFFTEIAPCMNNDYFKGRIEKARLAGTLDIAFTFVGDFNDRNRELSVRVQSAADGGLWIFHHRAPTSGET
jgi:photoactive yellow protein